VRPNSEQPLPEGHESVRPSVRPSVRLLPSVRVTFACRSIDRSDPHALLNSRKITRYAAQEEEEEEESYINYERSDHNDQHLISCTSSISSGTEFCTSFCKPASTLHCCRICACFLDGEVFLVNIDLEL
jgi:hypothetical protein